MTVYRRTWFDENLTFVSFGACHTALQGAVTSVGKPKREALDGEGAGAGKDLLVGIQAELADAVKKQAELEGRNFDYGRPEKKNTSFDKLLALIQKVCLLIRGGNA